MYKDKEKQKEAVRKAVKKSRLKGITSQGITQQGITSLPDDIILECNANITWDDIMALSREAVDDIYHVSKVFADDILLRLKRAAGYYKRMA